MSNSENPSPDNSFVIQESDETDFFSMLTSQSDEQTSECTNASKIVTEYLDGPLEKTVSANSFGANKILKTLFIEFNTSIPSGAGVERLFSLGKDVLRSKRAGLSDTHFEMLVFLKGNQ